MSIATERLDAIKAALANQPDGCTVAQLLDLLRIDYTNYQRLFNVGSPHETVQTACRNGWLKHELERGPWGFQAGYAYWLPRKDNR